MEKLQNWLLVIRPKTLTASVAPVVIGLSLVVLSRPLVAVATLMCALLLQIASNLANDYYDAKNGVDDYQRLGPARAQQQGDLSMPAVHRAMIGCLVIAFMIGVGLSIIGGLTIFIIGVCAIVAAILYSGGPRPLSFLGLGEVLAGVFFGPIVVIGTVILQGAAPTFDIAVAGFAPGFFAAALMGVNNLRDHKSDDRCGKKTLAVRFGASFGRKLVLALVALGSSIPLILYFYYDYGAGVLIASLVPLLFVSTWKHIASASIDRRMNDVLACIGKLSALYAATFAVGRWL